MRFTFVLALLAGAALARDASAQTPPAAPAAPAAPTVSIASLLADGYELRSVNDLSDAEQKVIWPSSPTSPYLMITLQKGAAVAVCTLSAANWISLTAASLNNAGLCRKS
jgi:hypothetical protein